MQPVSPEARRYDTRTIAFHWATVVLVAVQWGLAQIIDDFARGAPRTAARSTHILLGLIIATLVFARVIWRASGGRRLPPADRGALHMLAKATHWSMYALLGVAVLLGMFTVWAQGDSIYGLFRVPEFRPSDHDYGDHIADIHGTVVTILLIVIGVHATAALVHHYLWRDGVLRRMLPGR